MDSWDTIVEANGYTPKSGSRLLSGASFPSAVNDSWFEKVNYIGALDSAGEWIKGWTNFDPQNADY